MAGANGEANRVLKTRKALDEVKGQMMDNIEKVTAHSHTSERGGGTQWRRRMHVHTSSRQAGLWQAPHRVCVPLW
jgi:hypothetical protein